MSKKLLISLSAACAVVAGFIAIQYDGYGGDQVPHVPIAFASGTGDLVMDECTSPACGACYPASFICQCCDGDGTEPMKEDDDIVKALKEKWEVAKPAFKANKEELNPSVKFDKTEPIGGLSYGRITIRNRGMINSKQELPRGGELQFKWRWTNGDSATTYKDYLKVVFRSDGKQTEKAYWETTGGIVVGMNGNNELKISKATLDPETGKAKFEDLRTATVEFNKDTDYVIKIVETNASLKVYVDGNLKLETTDDLPARPEKNFVSIYNREPAGGVWEQSQLLELVLTPAPAERREE